MQSSAAHVGLNEFDKGVGGVLDDFAIGRDHLGATGAAIAAAERHQPERHFIRLRERGDEKDETEKQKREELDHCGLFYARGVDPNGLD